MAVPNPHCIWSCAMAMCCRQTLKFINLLSNTGRPVMHKATPVSAWAGHKTEDKRWVHGLQTTKWCSRGKMRMPKTNIKPVWKSQCATRFHFLCAALGGQNADPTTNLPGFLTPTVDTEHSCTRENFSTNKPCQAVGDSLQWLRSGCCRRMRLSLKTRRARTRAAPRPRRGRPQGRRSPLSRLSLARLVLCSRETAPGTYEPSAGLRTRC